MKLGEVCLHTGDVRRLANFYKRLLGIDNGSEDTVHQFLIEEETALTVYNDGEEHSNPSPNISLAFTVEDVDAAYLRLLALGIEVTDKPATQPWGARNLRLKDPDGNWVYLRSLPKA